MSGDRHVQQERASFVARTSATGRRWWRRARELVGSGQTWRLLHMFVGGAVARGRDVAVVDAALFPHRRYVHRTRVGPVPRYRVLPFELPPGVEDLGHMRFVVDLDKVTTYCGFSLAPGGWHPFVEVLRERQADPTLGYEDSVLWRLYDALTPATVQEALFDDTSHPLDPLDRMPAVHQVLKSLWQLGQREVQQLVRRAPHRPTLDDHSRYLGPKSTAGGRRHFDRLAAVHDSMARHGVDVERFGGGRPRGYFLVRGDDYRFVISRGNHRAPTMWLLGERRLVATTRVHHPPVVDEAELERWTTTRGGPYPPEVAQRLFDRMFTTTGAERAAALGLLPRPGTD